jgi:3,4-dihydroxy 2-butanone 4-phosphate synthase/GTP cyclohydrolase II
MTLKTIEHRVSTRIPTSAGEFTLHLYREIGDNKEHLAFTYGSWSPGEAVLVRMHSECFTGDVLGSRRCDCGEQLNAAISEIAKAGKGAVVYLRQEGRGIGLEEKLKAYNLQDDGLDTVDANLALGHSADSRDYGIGAAILKDLGIVSLKLLTNNPAKMNGLEEYGIRVEQRIPLEMEIHDHNKEYLHTKVLRMNHIIDLHHIVA